METELEEKIGYEKKQTRIGENRKRYVEKLSELILENDRKNAVRRG